MSKPTKRSSAALYIAIGLAALVVLYFVGFAVLMVDHHFCENWLLFHCADGVARVTMVLYGSVWAVDWIVESVVWVSSNSRA